MANPFEQFDKPKPNPFARFDAQPAPEVGAVEGGVRAAARGVPVIGSFLDELNAATNAALDPLIPESVAKAIGGKKIPGETFSERYQSELAAQRGMDKAYDAENPILSPALQIGGGMASGGALLKAAPAAAKTILGMGGKTLAGRMAASGASGAALGAGHGLGSGEGDIDSRVAEAEKGALFGGVVGAAAPAVASAVGKAVNAFTKQAAPTLKALREQSGRLYEKADKVGLVVSKNSVQNAYDDIGATLAKEGFHPKIHPKAAAALEEIGKSSVDDLSLQQIQNLRRIAQSAQKSIEPDERRIGEILVDKMDDFLENLKAQDVVSGDPKAAASLLSQARSLWSRFRKGEVMEDLLERASITAPNFSGSGAENAIRTEFRSLAKNAKRMRTFTPAEQEAIKRVAKGGPLANGLRMLGKFAPTGVVSTVLSGGAGAAIGGPIGAVALPAAGFAARQGATAATLGSARAASEMMRSGASSVLTPQALRAQELARALSQGANPAVDTLMMERLNQRSMP